MFLIFEHRGSYAYIFQSNRKKSVTWAYFKRVEPEINKQILTLFSLSSNLLSSFDNIFGGVCYFYGLVHFDA